MTWDLVYVVKPDLGAEAVTSVIEWVTERLTDLDAVVEHTEAWGKRRMAYPVQRYREGHYVFVRFSAPGGRIPKIRSGLKMAGDILRVSITVAIGSIERPPAPTSSVAPPQAAREEA